MYDEWLRPWREAVVTHIKILSRHSARDTEEKHGLLRSVYVVTRRKFRPVLTNT
jgi:hypothetical protein